MALSVFAAAAEAPDRPAILTDHETLTWAQLAARVRPAVAALRSRGAWGSGSGSGSGSADRPVALVAANDVDTAVAIHALIALGAPALLLHPRLTAPERRALLDAAGVAEAVDAASLAAGSAGSAEAAEAEEEEEGASPGGASSPDPAPPPADERTLAIVHTSGTSGTPRGVVLSRRAFAASAEASAANLGWRDDDRWLLPLPLAHVGGLSILTRTLLARRAAVLVPGAEPGGLMDAVRRHRVTLLSVVPTVLKRLLELDPGAPPPDHLRAVLLGGAAASPALLARAADAGWPVLTTYGLTEACSQVTTQRYGTVNRGEAGSGAPLPGTEVRIGDDAAIHVRGPTLFSGYLPAGDPPFLEGGWLATGDRGRLDDAGNLHVLGRRTDRIVTGGENVDPVEVEQALEALPGVAEACVFGVPDEEWGERVCAAVVPAGPGVGWDELAARLGELRGRLAPFKRPRWLALLPSLPRNRTGKVDRRAVAREAGPHLRPI